MSNQVSIDYIKLDKESLRIKASSIYRTFLAVKETDIFQAGVLIKKLETINDEYIKLNNIQIELESRE